MNKAKNGVENVADQVKCRLRRIAHANNREELQSAVADLRKWEFYQGKLKAWIEDKLITALDVTLLCYREGKMSSCKFNVRTEKVLVLFILGTWLPEIEKWVLAFRPNDLIMCNTNNGTERINEELKYIDLDRCVSSSLSELLTILIEKFLPRHYEKIC